MEIHVGCSGWFYSHWRGIFYPAQEVTTKNWFAYYANVFRTVELNAPFYRWPKPSGVCKTLGISASTMVTFGLRRGTSNRAN